MSLRHVKSERLVAQACAQGAVPTAVIYPCSSGALQGALESAEAGLIEPLLVGPRAEIQRIADAHGLDLTGVPILDVAAPLDAAYRAAALVREGRVRVLMKGSLHTDELMKAVASRSARLLTPRRVSHVFVMDVPTHERLLFIADAAVNVAPKLRVKRDITQNAIDCAHATGIVTANVAVLSAIESVNDAIPSTIDACALRDMAQRGEIVGGIVEGPLAFDNAISAQAADIKGIETRVAGKVDVLIVPGIEAGNILYKSLVYLSDAIAAGVVMGLRAPVVLTSRADTAASRVASAAVACLLVHHGTRAMSAA
ncbi:MAG: bifunctional enoyl-CoA hydratase/phosphate acetyltransferase [Burkholderiales bacterium]